MGCAGWSDEILLKGKGFLLPPRRSLKIVNYLGIWLQFCHRFFAFFPLFGIFLLYGMKGFGFSSRSTASQPCVSGIACGFSSGKLMHI